MPGENIRTRLAEASKMNQEPKDRLWAVVFVLIGLVLILGAIVIVYAENEQSFRDTGRELGFERGALECHDNILDNERVSDLPGYCGKPEVRAYLPPEICDRFFPDASDCASKWYAA